jgi:aminoglycoside phosphotransferase (APT) family kinase protein
MLYHSVDESVLSYPYAMFEWVDGVLVSEALREGDEADVESIARAAGRTLAAVNQFEFPQPGFLGASLDYTLKCDSSTDSFRKYLTTVEEHGRAAQRVGAAKFRDMIKFVDENLSCLSITEDWCSLVHADYTGTNLITGKKKGSWVVHAVLDWEFAMAGSSIFDIGVFLRIEDEFGLGFREGFIESFLEWGGHLPSGWRRASKMLDLLNQFALDAEGVFPHTFLEAETRIRGTMNRWREFKD